MKAWAAIAATSTAFTAVGFFQMFQTDSLGVGMMLCLASFATGSFIGRRIYRRMLTPPAA